MLLRFPTSLLNTSSWAALSRILQKQGYLASRKHLGPWAKSLNMAFKKREASAQCLRGIVILISWKCSYQKCLGSQHTGSLGTAQVRTCSAEFQVTLPYQSKGRAKPPHSSYPWKKIASPSRRPWHTLKISLKSGIISSPTIIDSSHTLIFPLITKEEEIYFCKFSTL